MAARALVSPRPNPVELRTYRESMEPEEAERVKHSDCVYYESVCLEVAVRANWSQFSCLLCNGYQPMVIDATALPSPGAPPTYHSPARGAHPSGR